MTIVAYEISSSITMPRNVDSQLKSNKYDNIDPNKFTSYPFKK